MRTPIRVIPYHHEEAGFDLAGIAPDGLVAHWIAVLAGVCDRAMTRLRFAGRPFSSG
jgi:hypothetical protein